jgi:4-carboxymuconolactone decarboxylase
MRKVPERFTAFMKLYPRISNAYESLSAECRGAGPLDEREYNLAKLGIAIGSGMEGSVRSQVRKSLDAGLSPDEIRHAFILAITAIGFPKMMAALTWVDDLLENE